MRVFPLERSGRVVWVGVQNSTVVVDHITLYESKVGGYFPIYEPIGTFDLGQNINHHRCNTDRGGTFMELRPPGKTTR